MNATVQAVGVHIVADIPKAVAPFDGIIDAIAAAVIARLDLASLAKVQLAMRDIAAEIVDQKISEAVGDGGFDDSSAMGETMRKIAENIYETRIGFLLEDCSKTMRQSATEIVDEKMGEAVGDDSSAKGEAMRKIAEYIFDEKIDGALEGYDCSEAIDKAFDDKDFESDMDSKIEKAFEEVDWAEELRNLRFRAV
jgi:hypothetical protein